MEFIQLVNKFKSHKNGELSESDLILYYFLFYHNKKYPNPKLHQILLSENFNITILNDFNFKKVKEKALIALKKLLNQDWPFILIDQIPTAYEVLSYQAKGVRPLSLILQEDFKPILNREDCFEFFIHDLEHGHMFFFDENLKNMQINFFKKVYNSLSQNIWTPYLKDTVFEEKFNYMISDMNTHKEHYKKFLGAILPREDVSKFDFLFED